MEWQYPKDIVDEKIKHQRHLVHKQILMSNVILKPTKTINKSNIKYIFAQNYIFDSDDEDDIYY